MTFSDIRDFSHNVEHGFSASLWIFFLVGINLQNLGTYHKTSIRLPKAQVLLFELITQWYLEWFSFTACNIFYGMSLYFSGHGQIEKFKAKPQFFFCRHLKAYWCQAHSGFVNFYYFCNELNVIPRDMVAKFASKNILASISCCDLSNSRFSINTNWTCHCKNKSSELQNNPATASHSTAHLSTRKKTEVEFFFFFPSFSQEQSFFVLHFQEERDKCNRNVQCHRTYT